jgi:multisubunit Na+/H+ antiporter MnhE subunit
VKSFRAAVPVFVFWLVLTGSMKPFDLGVGLAMSALLGWWAAVVLWPTDDDPSLTPARAARFILYIPWLIKEIIIAAVGVAEIVLRPHMPIDPLIIVDHAHAGYSDGRSRRFDLHGALPQRRIRERCRGRRHGSPNPPRV